MDEIDVQDLWDHRKKFKEVAAEQQYSSNVCVQFRQLLH
jgi:hypothetical protein